MEEAIKILEHAEVVLMKKIKGLQDGKPKYAASEKLTELRYAITVLRTHGELDEMMDAEQDADLADQFTKYPPKGQA